jgi:hypothetical protein
MKIKAYLIKNDNELLPCIKYEMLYLFYVLYAVYIQLCFQLFKSFLK